MRVLVRVVAVSVAVLVSRYAAAAEPLRPRLVVSFGSEVGRPGEAVTIDVASLDAGGAPTDAPVAVDVDAGKLTPPQRVSTGLYRSTITIPTQLPLSRTVLVLAHAGALSADASLRLAPGPAATIRLDGPALCREDAEACRIDVTAVDASGNPASEVPDSSAELGRVSSAGAADPGHWVVIYHPPRLDRERTEKVTVALGQLKASHSMKLTPATAGFGFVPLLGVVRQDGHFGFSVGGQVLGARMAASGWLMGGGLEGSWWSVSHKLGVARVDTSQLAAGLFLRAEKPIAGQAVAGLSLGGGAVRVTSTNHISGQPGVSDSGWAPTARAAASLGYRSVLGTPFVEARAAWVGDAHLATDPGAKWPLFLQLGYRLDVR